MNLRKLSAILLLVTGITANAYDFSAKPILTSHFTTPSILTGKVSLWHLARKSIIAVIWRFRRKLPITAQPTMLQNRS